LRARSPPLSTLFPYTTLFRSKRAGESWVINIGSLAGKNAFPNGAAYNASKFGLIGFSEALMQEVRYDGVRVSYIMPGSVATEFRSEEHTSELQSRENIVCRLM